MCRLGYFIAIAFVGYRLGRSSLPTYLGLSLVIALWAIGQTAWWYFF